MRAVLVALVLVGLALAAERVIPALTGAVRIADGDSLTLGGERIRLEGIDAPELDQSCGPAGALWPCGRAARTALGKIATRNIATGEVRCRPVDTDRYNRAVAVCEAGGRDLALEMVRQGLAVATGFAYAGAEAEARQARRGIWAGPFERPAAWRARHP